MQVRNAPLVDAAMDAPFFGYAYRSPSSRARLERVSACVALLTAMVVSGIVLGTPQQRPGIRRS